MLSLKKALSRSAAGTPADMAERIAHLKAVSLFEELKSNHEALSELVRVMEERKYAPGTAIIREGESGSEMFLLVSGSANVFKSTAEHEDYKVAILTAESRVFFGEGALLDSDARSATIMAETECLCLVLSREAFESFGAAYPHWALPILRRIARVVMARFRKTNEDLMLLYNALVAEIRGH